MNTLFEALRASSASVPDRSPNAQPSSPVEELSSGAMDFRPSQMVLAMNAYLIMHQGLDLQRWFEEQVSKHTKCATM